MYKVTMARGKASSLFRILGVPIESNSIILCNANVFIHD